MPPWSFSSLTSFETCARRYYHLKVAKDVYDRPNEASVWGNEVHGHLENRLRDGSPLPESIAQYERLVAPIAAKPGKLLVEQKFALDASLAPDGWSTATTWCRGIVDVGVVGTKQAVLLDWKTGKRKPDSDQLKLFAGLAFAHYPEIDVVVTGFVWLKDNVVDKERFERANSHEIWQTFLPRVRRLERAYEENNFPPKPSGLCRAHCPVPRHKCEYSGRTNDR